MTIFYITYITLHKVHVISAQEKTLRLHITMSDLMVYMYVNDGGEVG